MQHVIMIWWNSSCVGSSIGLHTGLVEKGSPLWSQRPQSPWPCVYSQSGPFLRPPATRVHERSLDFPSRNNLLPGSTQELGRSLVTICRQIASARCPQRPPRVPLANKEQPQGGNLGKEPEYLQVIFIRSILHS